MLKHIYLILLLTAISSFSLWASSPEQSETQIVQHEEKALDPQEFIMGHIKDAHTFHICEIGTRQISIPLPILLIADGKFTVFSSAAFHHDNSAKIAVERGGQTFVMYEEKIYIANAPPDENGSYISVNPDGTIANRMPLDFSITKNVVTLFAVAVILILVFVSMGRFYKNKANVDKAPKGIAKLFEPLVVFVRDDIARPNIGEEHYRKYMPFLLTVFFFILTINLAGLVPFFPFGSNVSGNTAFTMSLALFTFLIVQFSGTKEYWKEIISMPGVPKPIMIILAPVEFLGLFTKPFALTLRLFASILGGHIIMLSLVLLIFIFKSWGMVPVSGFFVVFMTFIELLVAAIQAYIFTMLSALYIGMAKAEGHSEH